MATTLTDSQLGVLIAFYVADQAGLTAPTLREISAANGWRSSASARLHVINLVRLGYLEVTANAVARQRGGRKITTEGRRIAGAAYARQKKRAEAETRQAKNKKAREKYAASKKRAHDQL